MKIGITKNKSADDDDVFPYKVWFRTSDGRLRWVYAKWTARIGDLVQLVIGEEENVSFKRTDEETMRETFLEEI